MKESIMEELRQYHKRLHLAYVDLLDSKKYAQLLLKTEKGAFDSKERIIFEALLTSFVVSYGRAFKRSNTEEKKLDGIVGARLNQFIKVALEQLPPKEKKQYKFLINERDKIFAHSDASSHQLRQHQIMENVGYSGRNVLYGYKDDSICIAISTIDYFLSKISDKKKQIERLCLKVYDLKNRHYANRQMPARLEV